MQTDKFKESAVARKNHIVSPDQLRPAKRSSNNPFIICHKKSRNQKLNIIILYPFYQGDWHSYLRWAVYGDPLDCVEFLISRTQLLELQIPLTFLFCG